MTGCISRDDFNKLRAIKSLSWILEDQKLVEHTKAKFNLYQFT